MVEQTLGLYDQAINHFVEHMKLEMKRFNNLKMEYVCGKTKFDSSKLEEKLKDNTDDFKAFIKFIANMYGGTTNQLSYMYASVIIYFADLLGLEYKVYAGFCLPKEILTYKAQMSAYNEGKTDGAEHPCMANHVYVVIGDNTYECYNDFTDNIEKIDVVEITEKFSEE